MKKKKTQPDIKVKQIQTNKEEDQIKRKFKKTLQTQTLIWLGIMMLWVFLIFSALIYATS